MLDTSVNLDPLFKKKQIKLLAKLKSWNNNSKISSQFWAWLNQFKINWKLFWPMKKREVENIKRNSKHFKLSTNFCKAKKLKLKATTKAANLSFWALLMETPWLLLMIWEVLTIEVDQIWKIMKDSLTIMDIGDISERPKEITELDLDCTEINYYNDEL